MALSPERSAFFWIRPALLVLARHELPQARLVECQPGLDPFPALGGILANDGRHGFELLRGEAVQQRRIGQEPALIVVEQVAAHHATGCLICFDTDEARQCARRRLDFARRELAADRRRLPIPGLGLEPGVLLCAVVVA